jgi:thiamine-monophosphate kinase
MVRVRSEAELIETFLAPLAKELPGAAGLSDDCATLALSAGEELVLTTDAVAAGVHFFADDAPEDIAWKALAINVSDLAGKGARPVAYLMALSFPEAPERDWLAAFAAGLGSAQEAFGIVLAGGDTDRRPGPLSITITAIGRAPKGRIPRRSGARARDRLYLSGTVGDGWLGLRLRQNPGLAHAWALEREERDRLLGRYRRPEPRLGLGAALLGFASASMDVSDGLVKDLGRLVRASGVGARVCSGDLPFSPPAKRVLAAAPGLLRDLVAGGDDYEVLAAVPPDQSTGFETAAARSGVSIAAIGTVTDGTGVAIVGPDGVPLELERTGWDHF